MNTSSRPRVTAPFAEKKVLLHSCCAPCEGEVLETLLESEITPTVFFYNPNIHPKREYEIRKSEDKRFCDKLKVEHIDVDYDVMNWFDRVKGLEWEPERGARCTQCFDMRFERTALYAFENDFRVFSSSLGISRWKNMKQISGCGERAAARYENLTYWTYNWRKSGGSHRMIEISKREGFYQQEYCGCVFSLRDTNKWRASQGREKIAIGQSFYEQKNKN
ncbi:MAG: epoxyqueuosine reductase QueH [Verrucomicrobiota bacterium]|nr:epoxyqueuosine reductase QueH [Verrucomicrobiota bacterium]